MRIVMTDVKHHTTPRRRMAVTVVTLAAMSAAMLACGRKPAHDAGPSRDSVAAPLSAPAATNTAASATATDSLARSGRHTHLKGTQTEAICTTLADVQQFYTPGNDPTQESLSCSMMFGGHTSADVVVLGAQGAFVHVRLYDRTGHFSDGYMRGQALQ